MFLDQSWKKKEIQLKYNNSKNLCTYVNGTPLSIVVVKMIVHGQ